MNLSPVWAMEAKAKGIEAAHWSEIGPGNAADPVILAYAHRNGCVLVTNDLDFSAILAASGGASPSVVQLRGGDLSPDALGDSLFSALARCAGDLHAGAIVSVDRRTARVRSLPIAKP